MKTLKWNLGIMLIWLGYRTKRGRLVGYGYKLRGEIPQRTWKGNHV